jgi:hypothetical protein
VLGGGYRIISTGTALRALAYSDYPSASTTWYAAARNVTGNATAWSIEAYAICAP